MCWYCSKGETNVVLPYPECCTCNGKTHYNYYLCRAK